jgi:thymidylate synthase
MAYVELVEAGTLGEAWLSVSSLILERGADARYDGAVTKELARVTVVVASPSSEDEVIAALGDDDWLDWMRRNFTEPDPVPELGHAASYATRLYDYEGTGRDQVAWAIERLAADPDARSATITTFQPHTDTTYVPCVSMLDFWRPRPGPGPGRGAPVELVVYAHSLDFGKKAYGNLVELARLQERVAAGVGAEVGPLVLHAKSAHVYEPEWEAMRRLSVRAAS